MFLIYISLQIFSQINNRNEMVKAIFVDYKAADVG